MQKNKFISLILKNLKTLLFNIILGLTKFNAYALHGMENDRHFESLYAVTDGSKKSPDFHDLQYFGKLEVRRLIPDGYNRQPFNDITYGNMWEKIDEDDN